MAPCFLKKLYDQSKIAPINILQNDMDIAGTVLRNFAIIGDVLTDNNAITNNRVILIFIIFLY